MKKCFYLWATPAKDLWNQTIITDCSVKGGRPHWVKCQGSVAASAAVEVEGEMTLPGHTEGRKGEARQGVLGWGGVGASKDNRDILLSDGR